MIEWIVGSVVLYLSLYKSFGGQWPNSKQEEQ